MHRVAIFAADGCSVRNRVWSYLVAVHFMGAVVADQYGLDSRAFSSNVLQKCRGVLLYSRYSDMLFYRRCIVWTLARFNDEKSKEAGL